MDEKSLKSYLTGLYAGEILASLDYSLAYDESNKYHLSEETADHLQEHFGEETEHAVLLRKELESRGWYEYISMRELKRISIPPADSFGGPLNEKYVLNYFIKAEKDAIAAYSDAIEKIKDGTFAGVENAEKLLKILEDIRADEEEHKSDFEGILARLY